MHSYGKHLRLGFALWKKLIQCENHELSVVPQGSPLRKDNRDAEHCSYAPSQRSQADCDKTRLSSLQQDDKDGNLYFWWWTQQTKRFIRCNAGLPLRIFCLRDKPSLTAFRVYPASFTSYRQGQVMPFLCPVSKILLMAQLFPCMRYQHQARQSDMVQCFHQKIQQNVIVLSLKRTSLPSWRVG